MSGVTAHGIHHPDGATPAKNLGPELKIMADDLDLYVHSHAIQSDETLATWATTPTSKFRAAILATMPTLIADGVALTPSVIAAAAARAATLVTADFAAAAHDARAAYEGVKVYFYTHSWGRDRVSDPPTTSGGFDLVSFLARIGKRFAFDRVKNNRASGRTSGDIANLMLPSTGGDNPEDSPTHGWPTFFRRLVFLMATLNDVTIFQAAAEGTRSYRDAWLTMLTIITSRSVRAASTANVVYSPGFAKVVVPAASATSPAGATVNSTSGTQFSTSTIGAYLEFNIEGDGFDAIFMSPPASAALGWGRIEAYVAATKVGELNLVSARAQMVPATLRVRGLGAGIHTVRCVLPSAGTMRLDSIRVPHPEPVPFIVMGEPPVIPAAGDFAGYSARITALKGQLVTDILSLFPSGKWVDFDRAGWNTATMLQPDGKHPNDRGHAWLAQVLESEMLGAPFTRGLNVLNTPTAPYVWPAPPATPAGGHNGTI